MGESLAFRTARWHVDQFTDEAEDLMKLHAEAMDCRDCETLLKIGIDAFEWLIWADQTLRQEMSAGAVDVDSEKCLLTIERWFEAWLGTCDFANKWISRQLERGFKVDNLDRFRKCEAEVRAIVKFLSNSRDQSDVLSDGMRKLRDQAIAEHRDGKTAEFFSE